MQKLARSDESALLDSIISKEATQTEQTRKIKKSVVVTNATITMDKDEEVPKLKKFRDWDENYYLYEGGDFDVTINVNDKFLKKTDQEIKDYLTDIDYNETGRATGFFSDFEITSWGGDPNYWDLNVNKSSIKIDRNKKIIKLMVEIVEDGT